MSDVDHGPRQGIQVISFLTGAANHVPGNALVDPACPVDNPNLAAAKARWDAFEREALGAIACTVSALYLELILRHKSGAPVFALWSKICSVHGSANAALHHEACLEFLSIRNSPSGSYTE